jgi:two-component system phosphate regulon sensor histidine kinase PhoR
VEASPNGVLLLDANHQITWCSRVAADHLGLDPKRDLAQPVTNLVRAPAFVEHMLQGRAGEPVIFPGVGGMRISALVQPYGDGLKLVLTQDITEPERTEAMRRNFVANVSHEIRTPLTVLAGFVETMSQLPLSEAERVRVLTLMTAQTQRMQSLVADLLTLAKLEGSTRPPADRWTNVADLMKRVGRCRHPFRRAARAAFR